MERRDPAALRQREHDRQDRSKLHQPVGPFVGKVVGVSFAPTYPDSLYALDAAHQTAMAVGEPLVVVLTRTPDNPHDTNAIRVVCPALGEHGIIGHLPSPLARRLAPQMDAGQRWRGTVNDVLVNPHHPDRPGIAIACEPVSKENTR